ncbi:unnamed protein product, partial [Porites evermanni]
MKGQLKKLEGFLNACAVQSVKVEEGENTVNLPQDSKHLLYASHTRPDKGDEKLGSILEPIVAELKAYKVNMPLTLIYGSLETISDCFLYFS